MIDITKKRAVICNLDEPVPIAYLNIYEPGDIWVKSKGCESCSQENKAKCCNNCGMFSSKQGCTWHLDLPLANSGKPWNCIVKPYPDAAMSFCSLEYRCMRGSHEGTIRRVCDPGNMFQPG